jgi:hypothetical protein
MSPHPTVPPRSPASSPTTVSRRFHDRCAPGRFERLVGRLVEDDGMVWCRPKRSTRSVSRCVPTHLQFELRFSRSYPQWEQRVPAVLPDRDILRRDTRVRHRGHRTKNMAYKRRTALPENPTAAPPRCQTGTMVVIRTVPHRSATAAPIATWYLASGLMPPLADTMTAACEGSSVRRPPLGL